MDTSLLKKTRQQRTEGEKVSIMLRLKKEVAFKIMKISEKKSQSVNMTLNELVEKALLS